MRSVAVTIRRSSSLGKAFKPHVLAASAVAPLLTPLHATVIVRMPVPAMAVPELSGSSVVLSYVMHPRAPSIAPMQFTPLLVVHVPPGAISAAPFKRLPHSHRSRLALSRPLGSLGPRLRAGSARVRVG